MKWKSWGVVFAVASVMAIAPAARAQQVPPDNTKVNKIDRQNGQKTADQQKDNSSDLEVSRKIRQSVIADKSLSAYAHNVKIITTDGHVTLRGPVRSAAEKSAVESKAREVAGADHVTSRISIKKKTAAPQV